MPQIGPLEILVVGVIALIVFGPERLPQMARQVGRAAAELRRMATDVRSEFRTGLDDGPGVDPSAGRSAGAGPSDADTPPAPEPPPEAPRDTAV